MTTLIAWPALPQYARGAARTVQRERRLLNAQAELIADGRRIRLTRDTVAIETPGGQLPV
jgi:hypothetical protein